MVELARAAPITEREYGVALRHSSGVRGLAARRPLSVFFAIVFGLGWPVLAVPLLADRGLIDGAALPAELFALGVTWLVMLPAALWVTAAGEGRSGVRDLLRRLLGWRLGVWWAVVLLALPVATLSVGLALGGSLDADTGFSGVLPGLVLLLTAVLAIHLCEETVWAGFVQTRLERRYHFLVAALFTAVPFSAIHVPLIVIGKDAVLPALGGVLVLGVAMRLLVGVILRGTGGSLLAAGLVHGVYNACNNDGALLDDLLRGADQNLAAPIALVVVTVTVAAVLRRRDGGRWTTTREASPGSHSSAGAGTSAGADAPLPGARHTVGRTEVTVTVAALAVVLLAIAALAWTGTMGQVLTWAWERHANVLSWYVRPLFVLPLALFSYRRRPSGIVLTLVALATSMFWFPVPAQVDPMVAEFLAFEREWLTSAWTPEKITLLLLAPVSLAALCAVFWKRSLVLGLVVINAMALGKFAWGVIEGDGAGWAMQVPAIIGLALCDAGVLFAVRRLRSRAGNREAG